MNTHKYVVTIGPEGVKTESVPEPCRCGQIHVGDYAEYEYGHHNCFHDTALVELHHQYVVCPLCGNGWPTKSLERTASKASLTRWQQIIEYLKVLYR